MQIIQKDVEDQDFKLSSYHLILMDCQMPVMDGYQSTLEIRKYLKENNLKQPIITAVTGHTEDTYV